MSDAAVLDAPGVGAAGGERGGWPAVPPEGEVDRTNWATAGHAKVVAEISPESTISRGRAASQLHFAIALRERLPLVALTFRLAKGEAPAEAGDIDHTIPYPVGRLRACG